MFVSYCCYACSFQAAKVHTWAVVAIWASATPLGRIARRSEPLKERGYRGMEWQQIACSRACCKLKLAVDCAEPYTFFNSHNVECSPIFAGPIFPICSGVPKIKIPKNRHRVRRGRAREKAADDPAAAPACRGDLFPFWGIHPGVKAVPTQYQLNTNSSAPSDFGMKSEGAAALVRRWYGVGTAHT